MNETGTKDLIGNLSGNLKPVRCLYPPAVRTLVWVVVSYVYVGAMAAWIGIREDWLSKLGDPLFFMPVVLGTFGAIAAAFALCVLSVPDSQGRDRVKMLPLAFFFMLMGWLAYTAVTVKSLPVEHIFDDCLLGALIMALVPMAAGILVACRGATTQPYWTAIMIALAAGLAGLVGLCLVCLDDYASHTFFYHFLPFAVLGGGLALLGRRIFRW